MYGQVIQLMVFSVHLSYFSPASVLLEFLCLDFDVQQRNILIIALTTCLHLMPLSCYLIALCKVIPNATCLTPPPGSASGPQCWPQSFRLVDVMWRRQDYEKVIYSPIASNFTQGGLNSTFLCEQASLIGVIHV